MANLVSVLVHCRRGDEILCEATSHLLHFETGGAAAIAGAVAQALTPNATLDEIISAGMNAADEARRAGAPWMGASVSKRIAMAVEIAQRETDARERIRELADVIGSTLAMADSVPAAFGVCGMARGEPIQTAMYAAALSGDADTVGAMACAIAGAWRGANAIPRDVIATLRDANPELDFDRVADGLTTLARHFTAETQRTQRIS
jgi:ADP-ribosylglycohydrolase